MITYVPMELEHLDSIEAIEKLSFTIPWSRQSFEHEIEDNLFAYYLVALVDERVVAYGGFWTILDEAHVTNIAVHPEFRRRGVAKGLLQALMARAAGIGVASMTLEVRVSNIPAQVLYRSKGFVPVGLRKGYYTDNKEDAVIMWRENLQVIRKGETGDHSG